MIEIVTPKKFVLNGLWFGAKRPKRVIIWVHGLGSSAFSMSHVVQLLADKETAVITFNNRGHDMTSRLARADKKKKPIVAGKAHEVFIDCPDDIQGAVNFVRKVGVKEIYLAGHSTGCQKSIYWANRKGGGNGVKGIILLAPVSDYAAAVKGQGKRRLARATAVARALVKRGEKHELLPAHLWNETLDAQRFLSLYTPDSTEEIFSYAQPKKNPRILKSVRVPILVLLAEKDEFGDRPAHKIAEWFNANIRHPMSNIEILQSASHSFYGAETKVVTTIKKWISASKR